MKLNFLDSLVFSNMMHRPARTAISICGIAAGVLLIVFTVGLANGTIRKQAQREANVGAEIMFRASGTLGMSGSETFRIPVSTADEIAKIDGVRAVVPMGQNSISATESNVGSRLIDGIEFDQYASLAGLQIIEGRPLGASGDETIVDTGWQRDMKLKIGDTVKAYDRDFRVVGTYEPAAGARMKIPLATMQDQLGGAGRCTMILIAIKPGFTADQVASSISNKFPDNQIILTRDLEELYMSSIPALGVFLNVIIGIASAISALIILLTMYTTVVERTRQIGILKSLGMSNPGIIVSITKEALLLSIFGIIFGVLAAVLLRFVLTRVMTIDIEIKPQVLVAILLVGLFGGVVGALYPALRAANLDAVDALAYE